MDRGHTEEGCTEAGETRHGSEKLQEQFDQRKHSVALFTVDYVEILIICLFSDDDVHVAGQTVSVKVCLTNAIIKPGYL